MLQKQSGKYTEITWKIPEHIAILIYMSELQLKAMTPEQRAAAEAQLEADEANAGICISCGS